MSSADRLAVSQLISVTIAHTCQMLLKIKLFSSPSSKSLVTSGDGWVEVNQISKYLVKKHIFLHVCKTEISQYLAKFKLLGEFSYNPNRGGKKGELR